MIYSDRKSSSEYKLILYLCQPFIFYTFRQTYLMKQEEKPSLKEKKQTAARDFIKMKRMKMKEEKTNESSFAKMKQLIIDEEIKEFALQVENQKPQIIMNFIFFQNQYREIPFYDIVRAKNINFLKTITEWSAKNHEFIMKEIGNESNQISKKDWENQFLAMNKFVVDYFGNIQNENQQKSQKIKALGSERSLFYILAQSYLTLQIAIGTINTTKFPLTVLKNAYCYLYEHSDLRHMSTLAASLKSYYLILRRDQIWKHIQEINYLKQLKDQEIDLLNLNQLGYTFWHEFAVKNQKMFLQICRFIEEETEQSHFSDKWEDWLLQFDNSGQLPIDKCLRLWSFKDIVVLLSNYKDIKNMILSTSCLNQILANRKLSQQEKETLIHECLQGKIAQKGYAHAIRQSKIVKKGKIQVIPTNKYECAIFFDKAMVRMQRDTVGNYPLLTYLKIYKEKSSLKCVDQLWFTFLDKKNIKKKYLLFLSILKAPKLQIDVDTDQNKQIEIFYDYYQPLWKQLIILPHCDILEHLVNKCYLNIFQMSYRYNPQQSKAYVMFLGDHFIKLYIQKGRCLDKNKINQAISGQILLCKQKEKNLNNFNLDQHLIVSLASLDIRQVEKTYLVQTLRSHYNSFIEIGLSRQDLHKTIPLLNEHTLIQYIHRYLVGKRKHAIPFFKLEIVVKKLGIEKMKQKLLTDQTSEIIDIYGAILTEIGQPFKQYYAKDSEQQSEQLEAQQKALRECPINYVKSLPLYQKMRRNRQELKICSFQDVYTLFTVHCNFLQVINNPDYRYGYVRLKYLEPYLVQKMNLCLVNGFDVYFNKYARQPLVLQTINDQMMKKIVAKMFAQKISYVNALITAPQVTIYFIQKIISNSKQQIKKTLFDRILIKRQRFDRLSFVSPSKDPYNIQLIIDMVNFANKFEQVRSKSEKQEYELVKLIKLFMRENLQIFLFAISAAENVLKQSSKNKERDSMEIRKRQKALEDYILQWFPKLNRLGRNEDQTRNILHEILLPMLKWSQRTNTKGHYKKFIESIDLRQFFTHQLGIKKISITPNIQKEFMVAFSEIKDKNYADWLDLYSRFSQSNQFSTIFNKFSPQSLLKILQKLIYSYELYVKRSQDEDKKISEYKDQKSQQGECKIGSQDQQQPVNIYQQLPAKTLLLIRNIHKIMPIDHKIQSFLMIRGSQKLSQLLSAYFRLMIMSTQSWMNTTAALIILNPAEEFVFYMKQNGKVTGYTTLDFYSKAAEEDFNLYLSNLAKYHNYSPSLAKHLQIVCNALIGAQNWERILRLIDIVQVQQSLICLLFIKLYNTTNLEAIKKDTHFQKIVSKLFQIYPKYGIQWNQKLFEAAFYFDYQKTLKIMAPELLNLKTIRKCIIQHPEVSNMLLQRFQQSKLKVKQQNNPEQKVVKRWFPCRPYYVYDRNSASKLNQYLKFENVLLASINQQNLLEKTNKCWLGELSLIPRYILWSNQSQYLYNVSKAICSNKSVVSFKDHLKMISQIDQTLPAYINKDITKGAILGRKKMLKCINLQNTNPKLVQQLITCNQFRPEEPHSLQSIFLRMLQTANLQLLKLFITHYKLTVNYTFLKEVENLGFTFWDHLLSISNQNFIIEVISYFNLFEMFPIEVYSPALLTSICKSRLNLLLEYTINQVTKRYKVKPVFAAAVQKDAPKITHLGVFYMPVQLAMDFNYYECYFLIRSCNNQCPKFRLSSRFISKQEPNKWNFIPEMKRRVEINNSLIQSLREAQNLQFRNNVLLPMIFQLDVAQYKPRTKSYSNSLLKLLQNIIDKKGQPKETGIFQKLAMLISNKEKTRIPEEEIQRKYPSEMNLIKRIEKYVREINMDRDLTQIINICQEFKPLLLLYNPQAFFSNELLVQEMIGSQSSTTDYVEYLLAIQINLAFIEQNHARYLQLYLVNNFFNQGISVYEPTSSLHLKRQVLLLLLLDVWHHDRIWAQSIVHSILCEHSLQSPTQGQGLLYLIASQLNTRGDSSSFDLMLWNKMLIQLQGISKKQEQLKVPSYCQKKFDQANLDSIIKRYVEILCGRLGQKKVIIEQSKLVKTFGQLYKKQLNYRKQGLLIDFMFLMNVCYLQNQLIVLNSKVLQLISAQLLESSNILNDRLQELKIVKTTALNNTVALLQFDSKILLEEIRTKAYFMKLQENNSLHKLDIFFESNDRHQFFKNYKTAINVHSFRAIENVDLLQNIFDNQLIFKVVQDMQKLEQKLTGNRNVKLYNLSDVYGPVNFGQANADKIFDCLGFYELLELPKNRPIQILFCEKMPSIQHSNQKMLQHIKEYLNYYVKNSKQQQQLRDLAIDNQILVYIQQNKNKQAKIQISWVEFAAWSTAQVAATLLHYCGEISRKIEKVVDVRLSYSSIVDYYSFAFKYDQNKSFKLSIQELIYAPNFVGLIESLMLMITQDVRNIMKLVKGIIIKLQINNGKGKNKIRFLQNCYATEIDYLTKQSLLYVIIHLQLGKHIQESESEDYTKLVSRKKFLDSVFQSSQFLTDYFLIRRTLDNLCLQLSTDISKKLNTVIHFHIQYANLYIFVDELRNYTSIKQIEGFLSRLKHYLQTNIDKVVNQYLASPQLANKHQICLLNKCEAIHRDISLAQIQSAKSLIYDSIQTQNKGGLTQVPKLMSQIGHDQNIKNAFLIQIYKSYYSSVVAQGMTFVVGYQSIKKRAEVVSIKKAENVNQINVVELDFILVVSKSIPTNDELNNSKIIRIFVTDSNWNLYKVSENIKNSLLALPNEHEQRNIAEFAPIIAPNLKLLFTSGGYLPEDTKDTKILYLDLGAPQKNGEEKFKLKPVEDRPPTAAQNLKKSVQFKQSINKLKAGLCSFAKGNITIVVDPPSQINQLTTNAHFDHIVNLVVSDLLQTLSRFQYQPMRNEDLDCKLSVEKKIPINQNSIVELRKRLFLKHYQVFRLRISHQDSQVTFDGAQIVINICYLKLKVLPSSTDYLSSILQNLIKREKVSLPSSVLLQSKLQNQSSDVLLKLLDLIIIIHYQIEEIDLARQLIQLLFDVNISKYEMVFNDRKAAITFQQVRKLTFDLTVLKLTFNLQSVDREFYSAEAILRQVALKVNPTEVQNQNLFACYLPQTNQIEILQTNYANYRLIALSNSKWSKFAANQLKQQKRSLVKLQFKPTLSSKFFLIDSQNSITSNYFYTIAEESNLIKTKNHEGIICKTGQLYLECPKKINFNTTTLSVTKRDLYSKEESNNFNVRRPEIQELLQIYLITSNLFKFVIKSQESASLTVHHAGHPNLFAKEIESTSITITSDGEMSLDNTRFVSLQPYKKKVVPIKDKENVLTNNDFREPSEQASKELFQIRMQDAKNIQNMVYVINDECKRFLTRAGEARIDNIQFCDADGNPISYNKQFDVFFLHINKLALIRPEIIRKGADVGLRWIPTLRGHYYIYINNIRINPPYEIGVCASQADCSNTKVTAPKVKKICFCQESEIMLDLKDSFGNIYSQLQEEILGDQLLIQFETDKLGAFLKVSKSQINKYGLKKAKFHFNYSEGHENTVVNVTVLLNREVILQFSLNIEGYSLEQRKKLLDKDVSTKDKKYYKELVVNRNKFLEDLITHAEKSLHASLSIRFHNEPGIDAGGVKREFYDMVGNQMKNEKNPFFKEVNKSRMEYFLNPQLLKNKKKLQYMQLWGKYLANSLLNGYLIGISFSPVFIQMLYGETLTYQDLLEVVPEDEKKQYLYLLQAPPEDFEDFGLYFTVVLDRKKALEVQLKQGGKSIPVTADNVKEYLHLLTVELIQNRYKQLIQAFKQGFQTVLELTLITKWIRPSQFWCLTTGTKQITPEIVLDYINFQGSNIENISGWFRRYVKEAPLDILTGFLKFSSGSSSIDFSRSSKITVTFQNAGENPKKLPISHTCWKEIVIPKYKNFDIMKKLLNAAFIYCSEGFGFG